ncbi:hypothetical protein BDZ94DRAFT_1247996 [Collybia nuda]|uniref:Rad51-like C-terminal domain-containing protein n=1 Tax=Collybia nuda TaxID=64659 RepID=A0A9P6CN30_9AGAR|nr:hypothetical protein BDZ94DRAFT_1247996 [Collybia nuda]
MSSRPLSSLNIPRSTLSALTRAGYETVQDLQSIESAEYLAQDLKISISEAESVFAPSQKPPTPFATLPLTQSAASMAKIAEKFTTRSSTIDKLLSGGIQRGHILEISGPPGTPKEVVAANIVTSFVEAGEGVIFVDTQNMTSPASLNDSLQTSKNLPSHYLDLVHHLNIRTLPDLVLFMHNLPSLLATHPKVSLLILSSISFLLQGGQNLTITSKHAILEKFKQVLVQASASRNLTIVSTSQLATKILNADGSPGTFDTGARGVMVPQLGTTYLPSGRTYRIIFVPETKSSGIIKVLSSPIYQGKGPAPKMPYSVSRDGQVP